MPWQPLAGSSSMSWSGKICWTGEERPVQREGFVLSSTTTAPATAPSTVPSSASPHCKVKLVHSLCEDRLEVCLPTYSVESKQWESQESTTFGNSWVKQMSKKNQQRAVGNDEDTTKDSFGQNQLSSSIREKWLNGKIFPDMSKLSLWLAGGSARASGS